MFVLGAYWERDPPRIVLGLKAHVLVKFCNKIVKTLHFALVEHEGVIIHKGLSTLSFVNKSWL